MKVRRWLSVAIAGCALALAPLTSIGCSGGGSAKTASIKAGTMPDGAEWRGVYFSQLYGYLHIDTEGDKVHGKWQRPHKDKWGELHGTIDGDLIRFAWTEHTVGAVGPNSSRSGKGYLKYSRPKGDNVDDVINGEIGRG